MVFEDKFSFFRRTVRGDAIASHAGTSRGERSALRVSRGDSEPRSPMSLSPRLGRNAPSEEDASALGDLVTALAKPEVPAQTVLLRKSPKGSNIVHRLGSQTPSMSSAAARHSSVMLTRNGVADQLPMDLGDSTGTLALLSATGGFAGNMGGGSGGGGGGGGGNANNGSHVAAGTGGGGSSGSNGPVEIIVFCF